MWVDGVVIWGQGMEQLISHLESVLARLEERDIIMVTYKAVSYRKRIRWYRKLFSEIRISHDPDRVQALVDRASRKRDVSGGHHAQAAGIR